MLSRLAEGGLGATPLSQARHVTLRVHGRVTCLALDGNAAWLGGVIEQSNNPSLVPEGTRVRWRVVDNGEGANAARDLVSAFGPAPGGDEFAYCAARPSVPALSPVAGGNVQVRG